MTENEFIKYLDELGIDVDDDKLNKLEKYYEMLIEYNKLMNLTPPITVYCLSFKPS